MLLAAYTSVKVSTPEIPYPPRSSQCPRARPLPASVLYSSPLLRECLRSRYPPRRCLHQNILIIRREDHAPFLRDCDACAVRVAELPRQVCDDLVLLFREIIDDFGFSLVEGSCQGLQFGKPLRPPLRFIPHKAEHSQPSLKHPLKETIVPCSREVRVSRGIKQDAYQLRLCLS